MKKKYSELKNYVYAVKIWSSAIFISIPLILTGHRISNRLDRYIKDRYNFDLFYERAEKSKELKMDSCTNKLLEIQAHFNFRSELYYRKSDSLRIELEKKQEEYKDCIKTIDDAIENDSYFKLKHRLRKLYNNRSFWGQVSY